LADRIFRQKTASEYTFEKKPNTTASAKFWNIGPKAEHLWGHDTNYRNTCDDILGYCYGFPNIGEKSLHLAIRTRRLWKTPDAALTTGRLARTVSVRNPCSSVAKKNPEKYWRLA
jgi:hypothetical protein